MASGELEARSLHAASHKSDKSQKRNGAPFFFNKIQSKRMRRRPLAKHRAWGPDKLVAVGLETHKKTQTEWNYDAPAKIQSLPLPFHEIQKEIFQ